MAQCVLTVVSAFKDLSRADSAGHVKSTPLIPGVHHVHHVDITSTAAHFDESLQSRFV